MSLPSLVAQYRKLDDEIVKETKRQFPVDSTVHWTRRGYRQTGTVLAHLGFSAHHLRLRVLNVRTDKTADVSVWDIEEWKRGAAGHRTKDAS